LSVPDDGYSRSDQFDIYLFIMQVLNLRLVFNSLII
jgi:hypothetical protein